MYYEMIVLINKDLFKGLALMITQVELHDNLS